jgi:hypothetical protein
MQFNLAEKSNRELPLRGLWLWLVTVVCLAIILHSAVFTWHHFTVTPYWDIWNWIADFQKYADGRYTFHDLIKPHNEHRIVTTRLVLFLDAFYFRMTGVLPVVLNFVILALTGAIVAPRVSKSRSVRLVSTCFFAAWMTSTCQWQNLIQPFQIQFSMLCIFISCAAILLDNVTVRNESSARAILCAFVAGLSFLAGCFSVAGGLLALPMLILLLIVQRASLAPSLVFLAVAALSVLLFLHGYHPVRAAPLVLGGDISTIFSLFKFTSGFLGSAFYALNGAAFAIGACGIGMFVVLSGILLYAVSLKRIEFPTSTLGLLAVAGTAVLIAAAAAVSRVSFGVELSLAPRYTTVSLLFWASLLSSAAHTCCGVRKKEQEIKFFPITIFLAWPVFCLILCNFAPRYGREATGFDNAMDSQAESMRNNVYVPQLYSSMLFGTPAETASRMKFMRDQGLSVFAAQLARPPDQSLLSIAKDFRHLPSCLGHVDAAYRLDESRLVIRMWLGSKAARIGSNWIVLSTQSGAITAVLPVTEYRGKVGEHQQKLHRVWGIFAGIAPAWAATDDTLRAIGLFVGQPGLTCILKQPIVLADAEFQPLNAVGPAHIAPKSFSAVATGGFAVGTQGPTPALPPPWGGASSFSTNAAGDAATGTLTIFIGNLSSNLAVPFAVGPDASGQSFLINYKDGISQDVEVPSDTPNTAWNVLAIPHKAMERHGGGAIRITARDEGSGWGQWLAVAAPEAVTLDPDWAKLY